MKFFLLFLLICWGNPLWAQTIEIGNNTLQQNDLVLIIEFKKFPTDIEKNALRGLVPDSKLELFDNYPSEYFQRLYRLSFKGDARYLKEVEEKIGPLKFIKRAEKNFQIEGLSIEVNPTEEGLTNDLFFPYLWALNNSGQKVFKDIDDIHLQTLEGAKGADIEWSILQDKLSNLMSEEIILAVVDSGVDLDHPDLKSNILKNTIECLEDGSIPFKPTEDKDGNGFFGDCAGWNFMENDNRSFDELGHGTHVAGIIAASSNNNIGITGLSNKIKILPIKVIGKDKGGGGSSGGVTLSDRVAKGILYAIKRGAKVINLSLGWPTILDTNFLRETFKTAMKENITIIAAAGNNNNDSPIFPCAYENVICVGSIGVDGKISGFSNYGGHVDVMAPGDNILSTFPRSKLPENFFTKGYEIKNGTSQSAPFVAAMAGILKSIYPNISEDELKARIMLSTKSLEVFGPQDFKFSSFGLIQLNSAINLKAAPQIIPILKDFNSIPLSNNNQSIFIPLKIKNFWKDASDVTVRLFSLSDNIQLEKDEFKFEKFLGGHLEIIPLKGAIIDLNGDHNFDFIVEVSTNGIKSSFKSNIKVVRAMDKDFEKINLSGISQENLTKKGEYFFPNIKTITDPLFLAKNPLYYQDQKTQSGMELLVFQKNQGEYKPLKVPLNIPKATAIVSVLLLDANYDGIQDFFVQSIVKEEKTQYLQFSYFDQLGNPLFKNKSHWIFYPEGAILDLNRLNFLHFVPYKSEVLGKVAIPLQLAEGPVPKLDHNPDPFEPNNNKKMGKHIYYFEPKVDGENIVVKARIVDNWKFLKNMKSRLGLSFNDSIFLLELFPQSQKDLETGVSKTLISVGKNFFTKNYILTLKDNFDVDLKEMNTNEIHFEGSYAYPLTNLTDKVSFREGMGLIGIYNEFTLRFSGAEKDLMSFSTVYKQSRQTDSLISAIAAYKKGTKSYLFFQTKGHLKVLIHSEGEKDQILSRPITRFSFLPGQMFTETFYPIVRGNYPALYVDTTQISRNDVYILTIDDQGRTISPIRYNLRVPDNCKSLNPVPHEGIFSFVLLCQENGESKNWSLRFMEIQ